MFQIKKDNKVGKPDLIRARLLKANGLFAASDEGKSLLPSPLGSTNILVQASNYLTALVENSPNMSMGDKDVMRMFISICEFGDPTQILTVKQLVLALVPHAAPSLENLKNMKFWKEHFLLLSQVFDIQKNCFKDGGEAKLKKLIDEKAAIASMSIVGSTGPKRSLFLGTPIGGAPASSSSTPGSSGAPPATPASTGTPKTPTTAKLLSSTPTSSSSTTSESKTPGGLSTSPTKVSTSTASVKSFVFDETLNIKPMSTHDYAKSDQLVNKNLDSGYSIQLAEFKTGVYNYCANGLQYKELFQLQKEYRNHIVIGDPASMPGILGNLSMTKAILGIADTGVLKEAEDGFTFDNNIVNKSRSAPFDSKPLIGSSLLYDFTIESITVRASKLLEFIMHCMYSVLDSIWPVSHMDTETSQNRHLLYNKSTLKQALSFAFEIVNGATLLSNDSTFLLSIRNVPIVAPGGVVDGIEHFIKRVRDTTNENIQRLAKRNGLQDEKGILEFHQISQDISAQTSQIRLLLNFVTECNKLTNGTEKAEMVVLFKKLSNAGIDVTEMTKVARSLLDWRRDTGISLFSKHWSSNIFNKLMDIKMTSVHAQFGFFASDRLGNHIIRKNFVVMQKEFKRLVDSVITDDIDLFVVRDASGLVEPLCDGKSILSNDAIDSIVQNKIPDESSKLLSSLTSKLSKLNKLHKLDINRVHFADPKKDDTVEDIDINNTEMKGGEKKSNAWDMSKHAVKTFKSRQYSEASDRYGQHVENHTLKDKPIKVTPALKNRWKEKDVYAKFNLIDGLKPSHVMLTGLKELLPATTPDKDLRAVAGAIFHEVIHANFQHAGNRGTARKAQLKKKREDFKLKVNRAEYNDS